MIKLLPLLTLSILLSSSALASDNWLKSSTKDEAGKDYQIYSTLSLNTQKNSETKAALILVSPKENIFSKIGFAKTEGAIDCPNYCQYYVQFDNTASKYTFSSENNSIKLENSQINDFLNNIKKSKEMTLVLNNQRFYFNLTKPNWSFSPNIEK